MTRKHKRSKHKRSKHKRSKHKRSKHPNPFRNNKAKRGGGGWFWDNDEPPSGDDRCNDCGWDGISEKIKSKQWTNLGGTDHQKKWLKYLIGHIKYLENLPEEEKENERENPIDHVSNAITSSPQNQDKVSIMEFLKHPIRYVNDPKIKWPSKCPKCRQEYQDELTKWQTYTKWADSQWAATKDEQPPEIGTGFIDESLANFSNLFR